MFKIYLIKILNAIMIDHLRNRTIKLTYTLTYENRPMQFNTGTLKPCYTNKINLIPQDNTHLKNAWGRSHLQIRKTLT